MLISCINPDVRIEAVPSVAVCRGDPACPCPHCLRQRRCRRAVALSSWPGWSLAVPEDQANKKVRFSLIRGIGYKTAGKEHIEATKLRPRNPPRPPADQ